MCSQEDIFHRGYGHVNVYKIIVNISSIMREYNKINNAYEK